MAKEGINTSLKGYDDIFSTEETRIDEKSEEVQNIPLLEFHPLKNHPFKVIGDESTLRTVESITQYGVLAPAVTRPREEGGYGSISGHGRHHASELADGETMPVITRSLDDGVATILMVDSDLQREVILPNERASTYGMKKGAVERTLGKPNKNAGQAVPDYLGKRIAEIVGEGAGESYRQVRRYIRLTKLIPELLSMVDEKRISFNPAVELSHLTREEQ